MTNMRAAVAHAARLGEAQRVAGLLAPVFALRRAGDYGIGDTAAVCEAIDFCAKHGFAVLQMLPIHETVGDHSPYNPISARALSPALLTISEAAVPGLRQRDADAAAPEDWLARLREGNVKFASVQPLKIQILLAAHRSFEASGSLELQQEFADFVASQPWLRAYTLFRLLVRAYEGNPDWTEWRPEHQDLARAEAWFEQHHDQLWLAKERDGFAFIQWVAWRQWRQVRAHAEAKGVLLMGEMSFGVSRASVDVWSRPDLFDLQWNLGSPPLALFETNKDSERWGQNWGLPSYRWENHAADGFLWLRERVSLEKQYFHICRLDHVRGYFRAYLFPWSGGPEHSQYATLTVDEAKQRAGGKLPRFSPGPDEDPVAAQSNAAQGQRLLSVIREAAGDMYLFAEIAKTELPAYQRRVLDELKLPGLIFPQFETTADGSLRAAASYEFLNLVSYGNHDHAPLAAYYKRVHDLAKVDPRGALHLQIMLAWVGWAEPPPDELTSKLLAAFVRALFKTPCQLATLMCSDLLGIPLRFNLPGSYGRDTWCDRLPLALGACELHPVYSARINAAADCIDKAGRRPANDGAPAPEAT